MRMPNYEIIFNMKQFMLIKDLGPWDILPTVTNGAEAVVKELVRLGKLQGDQRLFYIDSDEDFAEIEFTRLDGFQRFVMGDLDEVGQVCHGAWEVLTKKKSG